MNKTPKKPKLSHASKEQKRRNLIGIVKFAGFTVIAIVVGLVGAGVHQWYQDDYKPMHETVVDVNGIEFDMEYYIDMLAYVSGDNYQYATYFTDYALQYIEYYELIRQGAEELGITVSEKEINNKIKESAYDNTKAARDMVRVSLLVPKLEKYYESFIEKSTEHNNLMAMFLESEAQVEDIKNRITAGESFEDIAAELSLNTTTQEASGVIGWIPEGVIDNILPGSAITDELISAAVKDVLNSVADADASKGVGYWILKVTESETITDGDGNTTTNANVNAILVGSSSEAEEVLALLNDGDDFDTIAEQYSQIWSEDDGSMLAVSPGGYSDAFESYALNPDVEIDVVSGIIKDTEKSTTGGYWLYIITGTDTQDISETNMAYLVKNSLDEWIESFDYDTVTEYITDEMKTMAAAKVAGTL